MEEGRGTREVDVVDGGGWMKKGGRGWVQREFRVPLTDLLAPGPDCLKPPPFLRAIPAMGPSRFLTGLDVLQSLASSILTASVLRKQNAEHVKPRRAC